MKTNKKLLVVVSAISCYFLTSCVTLTETLYLRQADVSGPIMTSPVHLTDSSETPAVMFSPRFSYNAKSNFTGEIKETTYLHDLDTIGFVPSEHSLNWDMASVQAGLDLDIALSRNFAISVGVNYSSQSHFNTFGGNFGIGLFGYNKGSAFRFDVGLHIHSMRYDAYTVRKVVTSHTFGNDEVYIGFYHDVGESTQFDPYFNFTYNTSFKNWPFNIFINAGYVVQTLFSFDPRTSYLNFGTYTSTDKRGSSTSGFINITPGVYFNFGETHRILLAPRFYIETQIDGANPKLFILPMIQVDFRL